MKMLLRPLLLGTCLAWVSPAMSDTSYTPYSVTVQRSALVNFHRVTPNLYRSGAISAKAMQEIANQGIKVILSLDDYSGNTRAAQQEAKLAQAAGISFTWYPMSGLRKPKIEQVEKALAFIEANASTQPVLVHCQHGSDRTGIVIAAYRMRYEGWSIEQAKEELRQYGHSLFLYWWDDMLESFE